MGSADPDRFELIRRWRRANVEQRPRYIDAPIDMVTDEPIPSFRISCSVLSSSRLIPPSLDVGVRLQLQCSGLPLWPTLTLPLTVESHRRTRRHTQTDKYTLTSHTTHTLPAQ